MPALQSVLDDCDFIKELHKSKNDDYATDANPLFNFDVQEYVLNLFDNPRDKVFASIIGLKLARLATQLNKEYANPMYEPNNESVKDTFIDDATYTLLWKADYMNRRNRIKEDIPL